jgi:hypothetical protein
MPTNSLASPDPDMSTPRHQLISLSPLARVTRPIAGYPTRRSVGDPAEWNAPEGHRYVPCLHQPEHDPATHRAVPHLTEESDGWVLEAYEHQSMPVEVSKLTLMRRLDALGKWGAFKALLSQLPEIAQDAWTLAQAIRADDPIFVTYAETIKASLGLTDEQFTALLA